MRWTELAEDVGFSEAEPGRTRFARLETRAVKGPKFDAARVPEVRTAPANPFETWQKSGAQVTSCQRIVDDAIQQSVRNHRELDFGCLNQVTSVKLV